MPLDAAQHGHRAVSAFLWGLLPDDPNVIGQWARAYGAPTTDVVQLLVHVGEDCAGAVQLVPPERAEYLLGAPIATDEERSVDWLSHDDIEHRLTTLRRNPAASRSPADQGRFSLAGAQPKTTLYQAADGRWGVPRGRVPSTHILKPPVLDLEDLAYNEHFCLDLARQVGIRAAESHVRHFGSETAIVVKRYDRLQRGGVTRRVHQEDMCQALAILPTRKYESDGGPTLTDVATLLAQYATEPEINVARFIEANVFNWLIAGSDAHAKNYSILHATGGEHEMAPLYDLISTLPYPHLVHDGPKLAMAVHGERSVNAITGEHWRAVARAVELPPALLIERIKEIADHMQRTIARQLASADVDHTTRDIAMRILDPISAHVARCITRL